MPEGLAELAGIDLGGRELRMLSPAEITDDVRTFLGQVLLYSDGDVSTGWVLQQQETGIVQIFGGFKDGVLEGIMVTKFDQYPSRKVLNIVALIGTLFPYKPLFPVIVAWAKDNGASAIDTRTRPSVAEKLHPWGFRYVHELVRYHIDGETGK
jgi:hypothetical protein